jgi:hypothetical protein
MMAGTAVPLTDGAGKGATAADVPLEKEKAKRRACPPLERAENLAGTSGVPARGQPLIPIINRLLEPVQSGDDLEQAKEVLEGMLQALVDEALAMQQERERFNRQLHEYEVAQGFTPMVTRPSRIEEVRTRGRDLNNELGKDSRARTHSASSTMPKVIYSSPVKNLRAAAEVAKELAYPAKHCMSSKPGLSNFCLKLASSRRPLRWQIQVPAHLSILHRWEVPAQGRGAKPHPRIQALDVPKV